MADTAVYLELAGRAAPGLPLFLLGHSLFSHTSLAYLGQHPEAPVRGVVALGMNIWNRRWEPNPLVWMGMRTFTEVAGLAVRVHGCMPARRLGLGNADEARGYFNSIRDWVRSNRWASRDGVDYHAGLSRIRCPVLHVVSDGEPLYARPEGALRFSATLGQRREVWRLGARCENPALRRLRPGHMAMVTSPQCQPLWRETAAWIGEQLLR